MPVFNEEKTIGKVLTALLNCGLVGEVICVNDGSTDLTRQILKGFGKKIGFIDFKKNRGKGFALAADIKRARGEIVIFLDGDLIDLNSGHVRVLLDPILDGSSRVVLGIPSFQIPVAWNRWKHLVSDIYFTSQYLTGQRAYLRKDLEPHLKEMMRTRYGVEIYLNRIFKGAPRRTVFLAGLSTLLKTQKHSLQSALKEYLDMCLEIALELGKTEVVSEEDYQKIRDLAKNKLALLSRGLKKEVRIPKIKNKKLKSFLGKYIFKYIQRVNKFDSTN